MYLLLLLLTCVDVCHRQRHQVSHLTKQAVKVSSNNPFADFGDINDTDDSPSADAVDATAVKKNPFLTGDFAAVDAEEDPWGDHPNASNGSDFMMFMILLIKDDYN